MKKTNRLREIIRLSVIMLGLMVFGTVFAQKTPNRVLTLKITAPSLKNNMLNDSTTQLNYIYLPPSYYTSKQRYPAVYFLNGFGDPADVIYSFKEPLDELIKQGQIKEYIMVGINGINSLGGSFFVNSPVTGNWEDYVVNDLVSYVDKNYRTIAKASGRGIGGFSMGGFAAINLSFKHPEIFSATFSLSPGLFDPDGLTNAMSSWDRGFLAAYGAAFAPNVQKAAPYADIPKLDGSDADNLIKNHWENGFGNLPEKVSGYLQKEERLKALRIEYGITDNYSWIPDGCVYFSQLLTNANIPHELIKFEGGHFLYESILKKDMFPFFARNLEYN
jgi:pimeloyl-ACP methyl ester carboxylesterase